MPAGVLLVAPVVVLLLALLIAPIGLMAVFSFYRFLTSARFEETFTLANYATALTDPFYLSILGQTLGFGVLITLLTLLLGYPLALAIVRTGGLRGSLITALVVLPLMTSVIVRTYGWVVLLGNSGLVNRALLSAGLIGEPIRLLFDPKGVAIGLVHVFLPFMVLAIASSLRNVDPALEPAARNLGASPLRAFWRITLPLTLPGITAGCLLVFVLTISAFVTPSIMGGDRVRIMAMVIYQQALSVVNWPLAAALSLTLLVFTLLLIAGALGLARRAAPWRE